MQDFTDKNIFPNNLISAKQPKWLNKDRFWNFVFWFGMSFGLAIAHFARTNLEMLNLAKTMYILTLIGIPVFIRLANKTFFIKKDTFANSEGNTLSARQMPYSFPLAAISGLAIAVIVSEIFLPKSSDSFITSLVISTSLLSGISLYFILKNCPISILFNRKFWTFEFRAGGVSRKNNDSLFANQRKSSLNDYYTNPSYSSSPSNIYYESHRHRSHR